MEEGGEKGTERGELRDDPDRAFYINLVQGLQEDTEDGKDGMRKALEDAGISPEDTTWVGQRAALIEHYSGEGTSAAAAHGEEDYVVALSNAEYLELIDGLDEDETFQTCEQEDVQPPEGTTLEQWGVENAKEALRAHYTGPQGADPMRARFDRYDTDGSGDLGKGEVQRIVRDVGFNVDGDYVNGALEMFGKFDGDGDGTLGFEEFCELWDFLHTESDDVDPIRVEFAKYDMDGDGERDFSETFRPLS